MKNEYKDYIHNIRQRCSYYCENNMHTLPWIIMVIQTNYCKREAEKQFDYFKTV